MNIQRAQIISWALIFILLTPAILLIAWIFYRTFPISGKHGLFFSNLIVPLIGWFIFYLKAGDATKKHKAPMFYAMLTTACLFSILDVSLSVSDNGQWSASFFVPALLFVVMNDALNLFKKNVVA